MALLTGRGTGYRRRQPEQGVLYGVLAAHLTTFLQAVDSDPARTLPGFVAKELRAFLSCGILARGFLRVHCTSCGKDALVAFSCKGRGFCPSCAGRRMAEIAAHLVDAVLPEVPVRHWVLSLPYDIRFHLAYDPAALAGVRRIFLRALLTWMRRQGKRHGIQDGQSGAVCVVQRFDSALQLNPHFHVLVLDGVYAVDSNDYARFYETPPPSNDDVARLNETIAHRIRRFLVRSGKLSADGEELDDALDEDTLASISRAAVVGASAHERSRQALIGRDADLAAELRGRRSTRYLGFSLHADVRVSSLSRDRLEKLARYACRGPICSDRLERTADGKVLYRFKRTWKDGTRAVVLTPLAFIERLCALVPRPRLPLITYHGVLAPAARLRPAIVPISPETSETPHCVQRSHTKRSAHYYTWAELLKRVFLIDALICDRCQGNRKIVAMITDPLVVRRILEHLGLPATPPPVANARPPPGCDDDFGA